MLKQKMSLDIEPLSQAFPHGDIQLIRDDIFMVSGQFSIEHSGTSLQYSRNMVILRDENQQLTLINSIRLSTQGLNQLKALGEIKNVIRIGAFHGVDDSFYTKTFNASFYILEGLKDEHGAEVQKTLRHSDDLPIANSELFIFTSSKVAEAAILLKCHGGILITCDSLKNWVSNMDFFNASTINLYQQQGFFGKATLSKIWKDHCQVKLIDFERLLQLDFKHLLSAHGEALMDDAYSSVQATVRNEYPEAQGHAISH